MTAVVGRSLNNLWWHPEYDYGVDGQVRILEKRGNRIREIGMGFDFQSKTTTDWFLDGTDIVYDLEAKAYNDLVEKIEGRAFPFLLILLCLPKDDAEWLTVSADQLILQKCAFWAKLEGTETENKDSKRIKIPQSNVFTPHAVGSILSDIRTGVMLP